MRYSTKILILFLAGFLAFAQTAEAGLIVENAGQAMKRQVFEPGYGLGGNTHQDSRENKTTKPVQKPVEQKTQQPVIKLVDLNSYTTSLVLSEGQYLAVRLDEEENTRWHFENRGSALEFIKSEKRGDIVILLYRASASGSSRINFDKLENGLAVVSKVLQVRIF